MMNDILQSIGQVSIFGTCDASAIQSLQSENEHKKRLQEIEYKKRLDEIKKAEEERQKQEEDDYRYAQQLQESYSGRSKSHKRQRQSVGRGARLMESLLEPTPLPRARGSLPAYHQASDARRNMDISNHIHNFMGGDHVHSNRRQQLYWHGEDSIDDSNTGRVDQYNTESDLTNVLKDGSLNHTDSDSDYHEVGPSLYYFETCDASVGSDNSNDTERNNSSPYSDVACGYDQFKDAVDTSSSSLKQDTSPIPSRSSSSSVSPIQNKRSLGIRNVKPRLSNFLSNKITSRPENSCVSNYDYFKESSPGTRQVAASRPSGVPINSLNTSQRVIGDVGISASDIMRNYSRHSDPNNDFILDKSEFPPL